MDAWEDAAADAVLGFAFADVAPLQGSLGLLDWYLCGTITQAIRAQTFVAALHERLLVPAFGRVRPKMAIVVGLGELLACDAACVQAVSRELARVARAAQIRRALICLPAVGAEAPAARRRHADFCGEALQRALAREPEAPAVAAWLSAPAPQTDD